ncbi:hypothetical protein [Streptomyces chrestomyceticus]|uniref:hypothetical protein n=1 Tax=Streptomyces chrestomyceticus TaxID=68185 RepID=UPI0019D1FDC3
MVCTDAFLLHPDPYPTRDDRCRARGAATGRRLAAHGASAAPCVLVNHFPLVRNPNSILYCPEFALWAAPAFPYGS